MNEYQHDSLNRNNDINDSEMEVNNGTVEKESNLLDHKSKKTFLFILFGMFCLVGLTTTILVSKFISPDSSGVVTKQEVSAKEDKPEIRSSGSIEAIQEGELMKEYNDEQERLNALAEESRVYCIISSSPYFQNIESKGSLSISNPKESKYYTQVVIKTEDDKEMYVSPLLAPDEKIESDYLTNKDFTPGNYHCYAYFNYYSSEESSSYLGSMCAEINIVID